MDSEFSLQKQVQNGQIIPTIILHNMYFRLLQNMFQSSARISSSVARLKSPQMVFFTVAAARA